jgi:hypothetical protein
MGIYSAAPLPKNDFSTLSATNGHPGRSSSTMGRTEFARCGMCGFRQAPECFIATLGAFEDFAGDVSSCHMLLAAVRKDMTRPFEGDFHVGYPPQADIARAVCSLVTRPPTEAASLVERQNNLRGGGYLDRSNVTILRVSPLSAQFKSRATMVQRSVVDARILSPLRKNNH